jgi:hypothetical protein
MSKKRSYFWALHFKDDDPEIRGLSWQAKEGFEYAVELAEDALDRRNAPLNGDHDPEGLTPADLGPGAIAVNTAIKRARIELFGKDLSDSAISYQLKKARDRAPASCAEPECRNPIPRLAHARTRYCTEHGSGSARVARHRRRRGKPEAEVLSGVANGVILRFGVRGRPAGVVPQGGKR